MRNITFIQRDHTSNIPVVRFSGPVAFSGEQFQCSQDCLFCSPLTLLYVFSPLPHCGKLTSGWQGYCRLALYETLYLWMLSISVPVCHYHNNDTILSTAGTAMQLPPRKTGLRWREKLPLQCWSMRSRRPLRTNNSSEVEGGGTGRLPHTELLLLAPSDHPGTWGTTGPHLVSAKSDQPFLVLRVYRYCIWHSPEKFWICEGIPPH